MIGDNPLVDIKGAQQVYLSLPLSPMCIIFLKQLCSCSTGRVSMVFDLDKDWCVSTKGEPHTVPSGFGKPLHGHCGQPLLLVRFSDGF